MARQKKLADIPEASSRELIRACKLWDKITENMHDGKYDLPEMLDSQGDGKPYSYGDYQPLKCVITGRTAELTVGSSTGHKAKVDLENGTVRYFDNDDDPNRAMKELFEETAKVRCEEHDNGVSCTGVTEKNVEAVFKVLAMPTSMDFRLNHCKTGGVSEDDKWEYCANHCTDQINENFNVPDYGCDCSSWEEDCKQECVDNYEGDENDIRDCIRWEKEFFRDGPAKETLTRVEEPKAAMRAAAKARGQKGLVKGHMQW